MKGGSVKEGGLNATTTNTITKRRIMMVNEDTLIFDGGFNFSNGNGL